jgi:hypothetical protein
MQACTNVGGFGPKLFSPPLIKNLKIENQWAVPKKSMGHALPLNGEGLYPSLWYCAPPYAGLFNAKLA